MAKTGKRAVFFAALAVALALIFAFPTAFRGVGVYTAYGENVSRAQVELHFVDVGQGDACVIELPDGKTMLIDSGSSDKDDRLINYIDENIKDESGKTIEYFDYAILTHSDEDHCGEMKDVLTRFPAHTFYRPNQEATREGFTDPGKDDLYGDYSGKDTLAYKNAVEAGYLGAQTAYATNALDDRQNLIVPEGKEKGDEGWYSITFYSPLKEKYKDYNDYSPIIVLEYENNRVALSGDAEKAAEADFVAKAKEGEGRYSVFDGNFSVQAIKLGHHGSSTSSSEEYLEVMTTEKSRPHVQVVISCGEGNSYGHPHGAVLTRLASMGFKEENILRTDKIGNIVLSIRYDESENKFSLFVGEKAVQTPEREEDDGKVIFLGIEMTKETAKTVFVILVIAAVILAAIAITVMLIRRKNKGRR